MSAGRVYASPGKERESHDSRARQCVARRLGDGYNGVCVDVGCFVQPVSKTKVAAHTEYVPLVGSAQRASLTSRESDRPHLNRATGRPSPPLLAIEMRRRLPHLNVYASRCGCHIDDIPAIMPAPVTTVWS